MRDLRTRIVDRKYMADEPIAGYCLLVDDSAVIRKVVRRILSETHASFAEASTGREALESSMPVCRTLSCLTTIFRI